MSAPDRLQRALGEEDSIASTRLGGDDALVVTPTRSILYRAGGVLSEESVTEFAHDAERIAVSEGRRKATLTLEYGLEGEESFSIPSNRLEKVLRSLLAVNLSATDVIDTAETVQAVFFFDELTLVVTDAQVAKHVGAAVWDGDYESIRYDDVTGLSFEAGRVTTQVVLETETAAERIKTPQDRARAVREALQDALCQFHGVDSVEALEETLAAAAPERESRDSVDAITLEEDLDLLGRDDETTTATASYESDTDDDRLNGMYEDRVAATPTENGQSTPETEGRTRDPASEVGDPSPSVEDTTGGGVGSSSDRDESTDPETDPETITGSRDQGTSPGSEPAGDGATGSPDRQPATETESGVLGSSDPHRESAVGEAVDSNPDDVDIEGLVAHIEDLAGTLDQQAELLEAQRRTLDAVLETLENGRE